MPVIQLVCKGRKLRTDHGTIEYSHQDNPILIDIYEGIVGVADWTSIRRRRRSKHVTRLQGNEYFGKRSGELGAAEAAERYGTPTEEQLRILALPPRMNVSLECDECHVKLTRSYDKLRQAFDAIASLDDPTQSSVASIEHDESAISDHSKSDRVLNVSFWDLAANL